MYHRIAKNPHAYAYAYASEIKKKIEGEQDWEKVTKDTQLFLSITDLLYPTIPAVRQGCVVRDDAYLLAVSKGLLEASPMSDKRSLFLYFSKEYPSLMDCF